MLRFTFGLLLAVILLLASVWLFYWLGYDKPSYYLETTLLLAISVWVAVKKLLAIENPSLFTTAYLAAIVLQLLVWLSYLGIVFYLDRSVIQENAVYFLINCLIFIALQAGSLFMARGR